MFHVKFVSTDGKERFRGTTDNWVSERQRERRDSQNKEGKRRKKERALSRVRAVDDI